MICLFQACLLGVICKGLVSDVFLPQPRLEDCDKFYEAPRSATEMLCDAENCSMEVWWFEVGLRKHNLSLSNFLNVFFIGSIFYQRKVCFYSLRF